MRLAIAVSLLASCATMRSMVIVTGDPLPAPGTSGWVVGIARNAKQGAVVVAGDHTLYCDGRSSWPVDLDGRPVVLAGTITQRSSPPLPVGPHGERSAGAEGPAWWLSPCDLAPTADEPSLIAAEQSLFAAIAHQDRPALERLTAAGFILRIPGQADVNRATFLHGVTTISAEILSIDGEQLRAHLSGDTGVVVGIQLARVQVDGKLLEDRGAFADIFIRRAGSWQLSFALNVPLPSRAAQ